MIWDKLRAASKWNLKVELGKIEKLCVESAAESVKEVVVESAGRGETGRLRVECLAEALDHACNARQ